jgi:hypothetical protein
LEKKMMAIRCQWSAVALCGVFLLTACDDSTVPPQTFPFAPAPTAGSAATPAPPGAAGGRDGGAADAKADDEKGMDGGRRDRDRDDSDAGADRDDDAGPATRADAATVGPVEHWAGTTSQGMDLEFEVSDEGLTYIRVAYATFGCDGDNTTNFDPPRPLDTMFSVEFPLAGGTELTFAGTFNDESSASGTLRFVSTPMEGQATCGNGVLSWTAELQSQ